MSLGLPAPGSMVYSADQRRGLPKRGEARVWGKGKDPFPRFLNFSAFDVEIIARF